MDSIGAIIDVVGKNSADVEKVVQQFGGLGNVLKATPSLLRIIQTIAKHKDPVEAADRAANTLQYNEETKEKVKEFQRKHNLVVDGIVGSKTWHAVEDLLHIADSV